MTGTAIDLDAACDFVWREARLLDRRRLSLLLGDEAAAAATVASLRAFQNPDGGFGNALEPDLRTPLSQPQPAEFALRVLDETGGLPADIVAALFDWLGTVTTRDGGVPFALPSARRHPHAPWWAVPEDPPADLNPTAAIVGMLLKHEVDHGWIGPAVDFCWRSIDAALDGLAAKQLPDGGWPITWEPPSDAAVCEWRGAVTVNALRRLVAWGRVDLGQIGSR